ncbi:hypothetical protein HMPREF2847_08790 [Corynebacterium sp. HMSC074C03]|nr:hypothetical protein HMPREF2847_08790 [Corynebacterium sp. HMSC074C03]
MKPWSMCMSSQTKGQLHDFLNMWLQLLMIKPYYEHLIRQKLLREPVAAISYGKTIQVMV